MFKFAVIVSFLLLSQLLQAAAKQEVKLGWQLKQPLGNDVSCQYKPLDHIRHNWPFSNACAEGSVTFKKARVVRERLELDFIAHNTSKDYIQCLYITNTEDHIYMDDDMGEEYKTLGVKFKPGQSNRLALNQRKKITLILPRPEEASLANIHLGIRFLHIPSDKKCFEPHGNFGINFNQLDWDLTQLLGH